MRLLKFFAIVTLVLLYVQYSFQAATRRQQQRNDDDYTLMSDGFPKPYDECKPSDMNRKKRQLQMTSYDFFHHCLTNIGKAGIEFSDYLFCKAASGITWPDMAELKSLDSKSQDTTEKITKLEAENDVESVTTFEEYLRNKEKKAKNRLKHPKNPKGLLSTEDDDDDDD